MVWKDNFIPKWELSSVWRQLLCLECLQLSWLNNFASLVISLSQCGPVLSVSPLYHPACLSACNSGTRKWANSFGGATSTELPRLPILAAWVWQPDHSFNPRHFSHLHSVEGLLSFRPPGEKLTLKLFLPWSSDIFTYKNFQGRCKEVPCALPSVPSSQCPNPEAELGAACL